MPHPRPLSPHLQIYKWQLTMALSILHRITGVGLCLGLFMMMWFLASVAGGPQSFNFFMHIIQKPIPQLLLIGWTWAACFHLCTGIRHFFFDCGYLFDLKNAYLSGYIAVVASFILTAAILLYAYGRI